MKPNTVVFQFFPDFDSNDNDDVDDDGLYETEDDERIAKENKQTSDALLQMKTKLTLSTSSLSNRSSPFRISNASRPSQLLTGKKAIRKRNMRMVDEELVADKMDSVRSKMEYLMQRTKEESRKQNINKNDEKLKVEQKQKYDLEDDDNDDDDDSGDDKNGERKTSPLLRRSSSMLVSSQLEKDNVSELIAIMGDALALKKNIVLARHFELLDADKLRNYHETHMGVNMTVDVWVLANDAMNPDWDAMEGDLSLQVSLLLSYFFSFLAPLQTNPSNILVHEK
jgi:hypothetical protein